MRIGGWIKFSLIDYPAKVAAVLFTQGCNFRCPYCHNPELVPTDGAPGSIPQEEVFKYLESRKGYIEGVVVTGGEPTIQKDLPLFLEKIKSLGFCVKLDTNGSNPLMLRELIEKRLISYIAMDVKASWSNYSRAAGIQAPIEHIQQSIDLILHSGLTYQFRTTLAKPIHSIGDLEEISKAIRGADNYIIQEFVSERKILEPGICEGHQFTDAEIISFKEKWEIPSF